MLVGVASVGASYVKIIGYEPGSDVEQHSRIDLDQKDIEAYLKEYNWTSAYDMYANGGHSGATVTMGVSGLTVNAAKGTLIQQGSSGRSATGYIKSAASVGDTSIVVAVTSECNQGSSRQQSTEGCFTVGGGTLTIAGTSIGSASTATYKYRTIRGFSTAAQSKMEGQRYFQAFKAYWGAPDYADKFVSAALQAGTFLNMSTKSHIYRQECAKKGSAYWNVWMYVIREMEDAINDCNEGCMHCNDDPVHAWDEAVAFYAGSLQGADGSGSGKLLYQLANKRCQNYGTCSGTRSREGNSYVNKQMLEQFNVGQAMLASGRCIEVQAIKDRIVSLMTVPLVQGALRYAYKVDKLAGGDKEKAEMVAFTGAVLPRIAACNSTDADTIRSNMFVGGIVNDGFLTVKSAFENNYDCLGITCTDVGGLMLNDGYYDEFTPCRDVSTLDRYDDDKNWAIPVTASLSAVIFLLLGAVVGIYLGTTYRQGCYKVGRLSGSALPEFGKGGGRGADDDDDNDNSSRARQSWGDSDPPAFKRPRFGSAQVAPASLASDNVAGASLPEKSGAAVPVFSREPEIVPVVPRASDASEEADPTQDEAGGIVCVPVGAGGSGEFERFGFAAEPYTCHCGSEEAGEDAGPRKQCSNPACCHPGGRWLLPACFVNPDKNDGVADGRVYKTCTHCRYLDAEKKRQKRLRIAREAANTRDKITSMEAELKSLQDSHAGALETIQQLSAENARLRAIRAGLQGGLAPIVRESMPTDPTTCMGLPELDPGSLMWAAAPALPSAVPSTAPSASTDEVTVTSDQSGGSNGEPASAVVDSVQN